VSKKGPADVIIDEMNRTIEDGETMAIDWMASAGSLAVAAITALLKSQGRTITATELGQNADKFLGQNVKDMGEDESGETKRYEDGK
jgi:hypothetical protein